MIDGLGLGRMEYGPLLQSLMKLSSFGPHTCF